MGPGPNREFRDCLREWSKVNEVLESVYNTVLEARADTSLTEHRVCGKEVHGVELDRTDEGRARQVYCNCEMMDDLLYHVIICHKDLFEEVKRSCKRRTYEGQAESGPDSESSYSE